MTDTTAPTTPSLVSYVGRSWATIQGRREVVGFANKHDGTPALAVTGGSFWTPTGYVVLTPAEVEQDMLVDAANLAAKRKSDEAAAERAAVAAAAVAAFDAVAAGYLATLPAGIVRARARAFLLVGMYGGFFHEPCYLTRAEAVAVAVRRACKVDTCPHSGVPRFVLPDGTVINITKTEADLARFLIAAAGGQNGQEV